MTFEEVYYIEGQPVQGHMNPSIVPFLYTPPVGYPAYPHLPNSPLDFLPINKGKLRKNVKEEKKKRRRKKLLKLMILSQMINNNN